MKDVVAFRVYASTAQSVEYFLNASLKNELHIVLPFARDDGAAEKDQIGSFVAHFDASFTPDKIQELRNKSKSTVKFFVSIGGRSQKYQFYIPSGMRAKWIGNATETLKGIVNHYRLDGIDVYYEYVKSKDDFAPAIGEVIRNLKPRNENAITRASLTISALLISLYNDLYNEAPTNFDHVVYQSHSETSLISTSDQLVEVFYKLTNYPKTKIFAGHSLLPSDWETVPLPIFLGAIPKLVEKDIVSISGWIGTDHDLEAGVSATA